MNDDAPTTDTTSGGLGPDQGTMRERRTSERSRRRGGAPRIVTISWRDIPAQLTARSGDDEHKVLLHARFQHAIDRAAAVAGLTSTHEYVQEWRSTSAPLDDGDVAARLDQRCAEIEGEFPRERLEAFVTNGGLDPNSPNSSPNSSPNGSSPEPDASATTPPTDATESDPS